MITLSVYLLKAESVLPLLCCVLLVGTFSVILQRLYYKRRGKRFFTCAPLHHHIEQLGMHSSAVAASFSIASVVAACAALVVVLQLLRQ